MANNNLIEDFVSAIKTEKPKQTTTHSAQVSKIDKEGTVWVRVAGSTKETPTAMNASEVKKGDSVNVEWRNNKLYIAGNYSDPSAGSARVAAVEDSAARANDAAIRAVNDAGIARTAAEQAVADAETAKTSAEQAIADAADAKDAAEDAQASASAAQTSASNAAASAATAASEASTAATAASSAQTSASNAGRSASQAQAASEAAQLAALATITTDTIHYLATSASSGVTRQTTGWTTTTQSMDSTKRYLWTYHTYTSAKGTTTDTDPVITGVFGEKGAKGETGDDGVSVTAVQPQYYLSTSSSSATGGSWSNSLSYVTGKYIWTRDMISYSDSTSAPSTAIYNQALTESCRDAAQALGLIQTHQEYFWHDSNGAHVLGNTSGYRNDIDSTGMKIMDVTTEKSVAEFTADNSRIGGENSARLLLEPSMMSLISDEDINFFSIDSDVGTAQIKVDVKHAIARTTVSNGYKLSIYLLDDFATATTVRIKGPVEWELTDLVNTSNLPQDVGANIKSQSDSLYFYNMHPSYSNAKGYMHVTAKFTAVVNTDESTDTLSEIYALAKIGSGWRNAATLNLELTYDKNNKRIDLIAKAEASSNQVYKNNKGKNVNRNSVYCMKTAHGPAYSLGTRLGKAQLFSTTIGEGLTSNSNDQLCIGKYNNVDSIDDCAFVVGNGTSDSARSNALTVDWSGNVDIASGAEYRVNGTNILEEVKTLVLTTSSISSLPQTVTDSRISADHVVVNSVLSNPSAQTGDWTVTTSDGSLSIAGSISGSTTVTLYLCKSM